jgi:hypothetical protein
LTLSDEDLRNLRTYKEDCDVQKLNLKTCRENLNECIENHGKPVSWYQKPIFMIGGFALSFSLGALLVMGLK